VSENAAALALDPRDKLRPAREVSVELLFRPLAGVLVHVLLPLRVPPPALVLVHTALGLAAAVALARGQLVAAAVLLQAKTVLDNADGRLARVSGNVTRLGRYLDTEADFLVNAFLFAALGHVTGRPWLALAGFAAVTLVLSADYNLAHAFREAHGDPAPGPPAGGSRLERALARVYAVVFGVQDRLLRGLSARRLERLVAGESDAGRIRAATVAYHDRAALAVLANLGLSTQLLALGACLALGAPETYLWLALASGLLLPALQARRERCARRALGGAA
jgi:phosphatidylglycerophosphate synthase